MSDSILRNKTKDFAKEIVLITRNIKETKKESILTNQLLRSGTSIGANVHEAQYAQYKSLIVSCGTIRRMLISSCKTLKNKNE